MVFYLLINLLMSRHLIMTWLDFNEAGLITGEICRNVAIGVWSKIVAGENEAKADKLEAAELLVRQILMRASHLGHRHVRLSALDMRGQISQRRSNGSYTMPCPNTVCWTVHQEMGAAAFVVAAGQDCEGDSSSPRAYILHQREMQMWHHSLKRLWRRDIQ